MAVDLAGRQQADKERREARTDVHCDLFARHCRVFARSACDRPRPTSATTGRRRPGMQSSGRCVRDRPGG